ncbi:pyruvate, phosphate dikinase, chloroplastic-like [Rhododendron vialii]|uniref:pyruvate, phosphate dikinase, chloroplastic-like n=1 Tax=Rhododendron vialii TaxID=182163 RepID=UPI00265D7983|nr:pyruvate, phosphate dikinase, chloroplastic-like [Rhododendron vialii]
MMVCNTNYMDTGLFGADRNQSRGCWRHACAAGIFTARGGTTSHAAVVACGWGKCCIAGCADIRANDSEKVVVIGDKVIGEGNWISLNRSMGQVILGKQLLSPPVLSGDLEIFMSWADKLRRLKVLREFMLYRCLSLQHLLEFKYVTWTSCNVLGSCRIIGSRQNYRR